MGTSIDRGGTGSLGSASPEYRAIRRQILGQVAGSADCARRCACIAGATGCDGAGGQRLSAQGAIGTGRPEAANSIDVTRPRPVVLAIHVGIALGNVVEHAIGA